MSKDIGNLSIKIKTFENELQNLINYESKDYNKTLLNVRESGIVTKINNVISFSKGNSELLSQQRIFSVNVNSNGFYIEQPKVKAVLNKLYNSKLIWLVYKNNILRDENEMQKFKLSEGDIFKLGKNYIKVWKICLKEESELCNFNSEFLGYFNESSIFRKPNVNRSRQNSFHTKNNKKNLILPQLENQMGKRHKLEEQKICRICYSEKNDFNDPLIHPCLCSGSMKYIHYLCLKKWINAKIENYSSMNDDNNVIIYYVEEIKCELCKETLPDFIYINGNYLNISFYNPPFKKYAIFESIKYNIDETRMIHIVSLEGRKRIAVGRAKENDIWLPEIAVSRIHCYIINENGNLFLKDNYSKFGSLILLQCPNLKVIYRKKLRLQIEKNYCSLKIKKGVSLFSCCSAEIIDIKFDYQRQNEKFLNLREGAEVLVFDEKEEKEEENEEEEEEEEEEDLKKMLSTEEIKVHNEKKTKDNKGKIIQIKKRKTLLKLPSIAETKNSETPSKLKKVK